MERSTQTGASAPRCPPRRPRGRRSERGWLALVLSLFASAAGALAPDKAFHNYVRDTWSVEQGLPQIAVRAIAQDREGYLWAGTMNGLARFDGVRFVNYTTTDTPALPGGAIQALRSDATGRLWVATSKGLAYFLDSRARAVPVGAPAANAVLDVQDLIATANGEVLAATTDGLYRVVADRLQQTGMATGPLYSIIESQAYRWLGGVGGVYRINGGSSEFEPLPGLGPDDRVLHLLATDSLDGPIGERRIWAGTSAGLFYRDARRWHRYAEHEALADSAIGVLYEDGAGNLWVGHRHGLARLRHGRIIENIDNERAGARWDYTAAFEDREGNLWLGSRTRGLSRLWSGLTTRYSVEEGLTSPQVWSVAADGENGFWIGTGNGLSRLEDGRIRSIVPGSALPDPSVYSLLAEADQVWLGTLRGLAVFRRGGVERPAAFAALDGVSISGIFRDSRRRLWFATANGLYRYAADHRLRRFGVAEGLADASVRLVFETHDGRLLLGTQSGLAEFADDRVRMLASDSSLPADIDVTAIDELADGRLVIGTAAGVLFVLDAGHWLEFNAGRGLPHNSAFFIAHDGGGHLWVSGSRGVYRVRLEELRWRAGDQAPVAHGEMLGGELATRDTGQKGECCNGAGNSKGVFDGAQLWLPTRDGLLAVPTDGLTRNAVPPTVKIERIDSNQGSFAAAAAQQPVLPARGRNLRFQFTVLSFQDPSAVMLQYRLRGHDQDWQPLENNLERHADYMNLPPGDYAFEVRGANNARVWGQASAVMPFSITPFFYETLWFYAICAALLLALLFGGYRWQLRALTRRRGELESLVAQRTDALAIANEQLEKASYTDPLTGLRNRRYVMNQLPQDLSFYQRKGPECYAPDHVLLFALVDIDHFKQINDRHGHSGGDIVLQQFSALLTDLVRLGDYVTRWGGEEFLIVSRPLSREHALSYVSRICKVVSEHPFQVNGVSAPLHLTCSVGYSEFPLHAPPPGLDWQELIELADRALYYVKNAGRDGWAMFRLAEHTPHWTLVQELHDDGGALPGNGRLEILSSFSNAPVATSLSEERRLRIVEPWRSR